MADKTRVRWSKLKVGIVGLAAFFILFVLVFLLTSSKGLFQSWSELNTYMGDASGLPEGTTVSLNGIPIGYLDHFQLTNSRDPKRAIQFVLKVKSVYLKDIPVDSIVSGIATNVLGGKVLNIVRGNSPQTVKNGSELTASQTQDINQIMAQMGTVFQSFQGIVTRVDNLLAGVEAGHGNLGLLIKDEQLYNRLNAIAAEGQQVLVDVRKGNGTISKLIYDDSADSLYNQIQKPIKRLDDLMASIQNGPGTASRLINDPKLYDEAQKTIQDIDKVVADLNAGKGTAGALLKSDDLHKQLDTLLGKLNAVVDKINAGQGTIGQLAVNPQLYDAMTDATREFQGLAKDIRANPKKFLTLRLAIF